MRQTKIEISPLLAIDLWRMWYTGHPDLEPQDGGTLPCPMLETRSLIPWGTILVHFTLEQGAEMSHTFCKLHILRSSLQEPVPWPILTFQLSFSSLLLRRG